MLDGNENQEIIIVRRGGDGDHGHHGGAWKIAFADFMTAMMALFLVLWLINAANEETKKSVASYFNPVKLVDRNRSSKGLEESGGPVELEVKEQDPSCSCEPNESENSESGAKNDEAFFADPSEALEEIVTAHAEMQAQEGSLFETEIEQAPGEETFTSPRDGEFVDPFSPDFWTAEDTSIAVEQAAETQSEMGEPTEVADAPIIEERPEEMAGEMVEETPSMTAEMQEIDDNTTASYEDPAAMVKPAEEELGESELVEDLISEEEGEGLGESAEEVEPSPAEELAAELDEDLIRILDAIGLGPDQVTIVRDQDSVAISLADNLDFSMFGIGSAVPSAELVNAISVIGNTLVDKPVEISIVGHTDGRPYVGEQYDNWRLSAARAHATLYMLERGGISQDYVASIAGVADRQLLNADDSFAPENRRIEILVEFKSP